MVKHQKISKYFENDYSLELNIGLFIVRNCFELWEGVLALLAGVASIDWLRTGHIGVVNCIDSLSVWSRVIILILHRYKGDLEQLKGVPESYLNYYK